MSRDTLPRNVEAEAALIGALMVENSIIDTIADRLTSADFYEHLHGRLFDTIVSLHGQGKTANPVTLKPFFEKDEAMSLVGGVGYLARLTASDAGLIGARDFARQISDMAKLRRLAAFADDLGEKARNTSDAIDPVALLSDAESDLFAVSGEGGGGIQTQQGAGCIDAMLSQLDDGNRGVMCKLIPPMDDLLGGARRKQLIILAARPGMGKTAVALSYSIGAAMNGHGVLYVSLEMSAAELGARMAADLCFNGNGGVYFSDIINQRVKQADRERLNQARAMASDLPMSVIDASSIHVNRLNAIVRRQARRFASRGERLDMIVVDYLQLLSADKGKSAYESVSQISRALKEIAKEHDVAVLALAQLSREVEKRSGCRPQLSDLRDSGQIEQDADTVMFLLRNEYYLRKEQPEMTSPDFMKWEQAMQEHAGKIEFICAKRRNGETGKAIGAFHGAYQAVRGL